MRGDCSRYFHEALKLELESWRLFTRPMHAAPFRTIVDDGEEVIEYADCARCGSTLCRFVAFSPSLANVVQQ